MSFFGQPKVPEQAESFSEQDGVTQQIPELPTPKSNTIISRDIILSGKISGEGVVQVEGTVEGEVNLKGYLSVTATGVIKGPVEADVIRIAGQVEGSILCHDHLQLERTGTIEGDVTTQSFVIENGGRLNGRATMTEVPQADVPRVDVEQANLQFGKNYKGSQDEEES